MGCHGAIRVTVPESQSFLGGSVKPVKVRRVLVLCERLVDRNLAMFAVERAKPLPVLHPLDKHFLNYNLMIA